MIIPRKVLWVLGLTTAAAGMLVGIPSTAVQATAVQGNIVVTSQPSTMRHERHPEMRMAIRHLEEAKHELEGAAHDYDGHRAEALKATEEALKQCHEALEADQK